MNPKQMLEAVIEKAIKNGYFLDVDPNGCTNCLLFSPAFISAYFGGEWMERIYSVTTSEDPLLYYYQHLEC